MRFPEALYYAIKLIRENPSWVLCGSTAMILSGEIDVRDVHDIDFIVQKSKINTDELVSSSDYSLINTGDGYTCYILKNDFGCPFDINLFVFDDNKPINKKTVSIKIPIQNPKEMIKWKKKYDREKDRADLSLTDFELF